MDTISLYWVSGKLMVGIGSNNHSIAIGKLPENAEQFSGMKPSDLLLLAAASCSSYDILEILRKQREPLQAFKVVCSGEQQQEPPYSFTSINIHYIIHGEVDEEKLQKAIKLSEDKYCSVISTLRTGVPITSDFEIVVQ